MRGDLDFDRLGVERAILELADMVHENRMLKKENSDLRLRLAASEALIASFAGHDNGEYEFLSEIIRKNGTVDLCRSAGWETNQDRVDGWESELERYREERARARA